MAELDHRVKNTLAAVQSIASRTMGRSPDVESFSGRLAAMAKAHNLLSRSSWEGAELASLLHAMLDAYGARVSLDGVIFENKVYSASIHYRLAADPQHMGDVLHDIVNDVAQAYGLWSDGGRASGLTPEQFAAAFAGVTALDAQPGEPGPVEAAAGSRFIEVPLLLRSTHADGSVRTQAGRVVLRRAVVDGASAEQRAWRIASTDLRDAAN
jgi:hypothetical protein